MSDKVSAELSEAGEDAHERAQVRAAWHEAEADAEVEVAARADAPTRPPISRTASTGRVRHDGKITVYVSNDELIALEQTRLALRAEYGLSVDRGRIVRAAVAAAVEDLLENGADSDLVTRLTEQ